MASSSDPICGVLLTVYSYGVACLWSVGRAVESWGEAIVLVQQYCAVL